ncbi:hypothetical protein HZA86_05185 [Candidatus Uhrbacteria bacterium]|nr:hypothetical protein [Candidatus Uhrbacteria bacterium]
MDHSILDKVMEAQVNERASHLQIPEMLDALFSRLTSRERDILTRRFGLYGQQQLTLKDIGSQFAITRERVRQIESSALARLKELVRDASVRDVVDPMITSTVHLIEGHGGIINRQQLWEVICEHSDTSSPDSGVRQALEFVLEHLLGDRIDALAETKDRHEGWKLHFFDIEGWLKTVTSAIAVLEAHAAPMDEPIFFRSLSDRHPDHSESVIRSHIRLSKRIRKNVLGQWGLHHWNVIAPRRVNDKIYLILKKEGKPLHFNDITQRINETGFDQKTAYPSTVHNELILDKKYILVGRGIYALAEWGYTPGVVSDVIAEILSTSPAPLHRDTIIQEVLKRRMVRKSTIVLALTDRSRFDRTADGRYQLAQTVKAQG